MRNQKPTERTNSVSRIFEDARLAAVAVFRKLEYQLDIYGTKLHFEQFLNHLTIYHNVQRECTLFKEAIEGNAPDEVRKAIEKYK